MAATSIARAPDDVSLPALTGVASVLACSVSADLLLAGGLAPLAAAAVVAVFVGVPVARAEWRGPVDEGAGARVVRRSLAELAGLGLLATAAATLPLPSEPAVPGASWAAVAVALGAWPAGAVLGRRPRLAAAVVATVVIGAAAWAAAALRTSPPWTLLEPHLEAARRFAPRAVVLGALAAGAGLGPFATRTRPPGQWRAPWVAAGLTLAVATLVSVAQGATWEASLGTASPVVHPALAAVALVAGTMASGGGRGRLVGGLLATAWLLGPGAAARPFVLDALVPLCAAGSLALAARATAGAERLWTGLGAVVLAGAALAGGPPAPEALGQAVAVGLLLVGAFWVVATRAVLAQRTA